MKLMITGGAGFIGSRFCEIITQEQFLPIGSELIVVDALTYAGKLSNLDNVMGSNHVKFYQVDIRDKESLFQLAAKHSIDCIVNFAAETHVDRSIESPSHFYSTNVLGTLNLLEYAKKFKVRRFVQISTDEVYGSIYEGSWDEDSPLQPHSPYSASKAAADLLVLSYFHTYNLDTVITRSCNNYGPRQYPEKIIPLFASYLMENRKIPVYGNGKNVREWIYVDDNCRAIAMVLQKGASGSVYNIPGTIHLQNIELARMIVKHFKLDASNFIEYVSDRKGHDFRYALSGKKLIQEMNFKPKIDFEMGLEDTLNWYISHPDWLKDTVNRKLD